MAARLQEDLALHLSRGCGTPLDRLEPLRHFAERSLFRLEGFRFEGGYFLCFEGPGLWKFPNFNFGHLSAVSGTCELNDVRNRQYADLCFNSSGPYISLDIFQNVGAFVLPPAHEEEPNINFLRLDSQFYS